MKRALLFALLAIPSLAQESNRGLYVSQSALIAATVADVMSSRNLYEQNPILGRGPFEVHNQGAKSLAITGAFVVAQTFLARKFPSTKRVFKYVNFAGSAAHATAAAHNWSIR